MSGVELLTYLDGSSYTAISASGYGMSVANGGDIDGDGYGDLVVGAPRFNCETGLALLYFGGPRGPNTHPEIELHPPTASGSDFGQAVMGVGDLNGDRLSDLAIGSYGGVSIYYGRADRGLETPDLVVHSVDPGGGIPELAFGTVLGTPGDLNGDGYEDLIVGGPEDGVFVGGEPGGGGSGRVYVFPGSSTGVSARPLFELQKASDTVDFGISITCPGDVDGDGLEDLVVGAFGSFNLFRGRRGGPSLAPDYEQADPDHGPEDNFGAYVN